MSGRLQELISAYLHGGISVEDEQALRNLLKGDSEARAEFVRAIDMHGELRSRHKISKSFIFL